jgi:hypothetical protein
MACFVAYLLAMRLFAIGGKYSIEVPVPILSWLTWLAFAAGFLLFASVHMFAALRRVQMLPDEFSYSGGKPWKFWLQLPFVGDEWDFERFYEPTIIIAVGVALVVLRNWFGTYLIIAGVCAWFVARRKHNTRRELELNVLDTKAEASNVPRFDTAPVPSAVKANNAQAPAQSQQANDSDPFKRLQASNPELASQIQQNGDGEAEDGQ